MRHLVLLSMMVLAARSHAEESCVLRAPLKATVPGGISTWQSLPAGTTLTPVHKKSDWSRVKKGDDLYIVSTAQLNNACTVTPAAAPATTTAAAAPAAPATTTAVAAPAAAAAAAAPATTTAVAAPAAAAAPATTTAVAAAAAPAAAATTTAAAAPAAPAAAATTTAAAAPAAPAASATTSETPALASLKAKTEPQSSSTTPGQVVVLGALALGALGTAFFVRRRSVVEQQHLDVVASRTLGRNKQLLVVDAGDARLLLGVTEQGITVLSSMPQASRAAAAMAPLTIPGTQTTSTTSTTSLASLAGAFADEAPAAGGLLKGLGAKVNGLWGKPPAGSPSEWDSFDRILASTVPGAAADDAAPSMSRRSPERTSTGVTGAADIAELARDLNRAGLRRSA